ncbi:hypothetical protein [Metabacillus halosaccharovorans]|uniref:hypothetical protein n=1 Tax=Metabacillus halosaccharovorans TaxID=930124 RepID=UPI0020406116|nr:hypothetical protein [Metabacillus halosaccharovorans]MCM3442928.1 hypothetical protein [Metabacillus halosaccharovorans]
MPVIRQGSLFGIQDLYDLEPTQRFDAIFTSYLIEIHQSSNFAHYQVYKKYKSTYY